MVAVGCVILAAGLGTRMRPLTDNMPKPMVNVLGKPLIGYVLDMVQQINCKSVVMNIHYKPETLVDYVNEYYPFVQISDETDILLDSGGGVAKALPFITEDYLFVINSDCIWHSDINPLMQLLKVFQPETMDVLKLLYPSQEAIGFDEKNLYDLDPQGRILQGHDGEKQYSFTGIQIVKKSLFESYGISPFSIREIWKTVAGQHRFYGVPFVGEWYHIGTPEAVLQTEQNLVHKL